MKKSAKENDKVLEELKRLKRENRRLKSKLLSYKNADKSKSGKIAPTFDIPSFFKNSGSVSRQDLHLWSIANPSLIKIIDWKKFQELQDSLSKTYNISSIVCDTDGKSITKLSHYITSGKKKIAGNKKSLGFLNTLKSKSADPKPYWAYYKETGLWNVLVPLNDEGEILGYWLSAFPDSGKNKKGKTEASKHNAPPGEFKKFVNILEGIGSSFVDMRNRKKIDEELKLLAYMVKSVSEVITITDFNDNLIFVNEAFISEYGYSREEVIGKNVSMLRPPETPKEILDSLGLKTIEKPWRGELYNRRKDGHIFPIILSTSVIYDENNKPIALVGIAQNISERKKIEQHLRESERMWSDILNFLPDPVMVINTKGTLLVWNKAAERLTGFKAQHLLGKGNYEYSIPYYGERRPMLLNYVFNEYSGGLYPSFRKENDVVVGESYTPLLRSKGAYLWGKAAALYDSTGKPFGSVEVIRDITIRKEMEIDLLQSKNRAEKADKLKSEFLTQISHEIRTPLNIILNYTSLIYELMEDNLDESAKDMFDSIGRGGARLMRTVELILNMSQALTDNIEIKPMEINVSDIIRSIVIEYARQAQSKKLSLIFDDKSGGRRIVGDFFTISQIFQNLIDNAIKYTESGEVRVTIFITEKNYLAAEVKDTGIGISNEYLPDLFNLFSQEEGGYTRRFEGNGLGLALVKRYSELNNASIKVKSKKGEGSSFTVVFFGNV
jgi:PAS domain S-box-containing protein